MSRSLLTAVVVAAVLGGAGCGGSDDDDDDAAPASARTTTTATATATPTATRGAVSNADAGVVLTMSAHFRAWNSAAGLWVKAQQAGDRKRFLKVHNRVLSALNDASLGIRLTASKMSDPELRRLLVPVGDAYRGQYDAIVDMGDAAAQGDERAGNLALRRLRRANRRGNEAFANLTDQYPDFAP